MFGLFSHVGFVPPGDLTVETANDSVLSSFTPHSSFFKFCHLRTTPVFQYGHELDLESEIGFPGLGEIVFKEDIKNTSPTTRLTSETTVKLKHEDLYNSNISIRNEAKLLCVLKNTANSFRLNSDIEVVSESSKNTPQFFRGRIQVNDLKYPANVGGIDMAFGSDKNSNDVHETMTRWFMNNHRTSMGISRCSSVTNRHQDLSHFFIATSLIPSKWSIGLESFDRSENREPYSRYIQMGSQLRGESWKLSTLARWAVFPPTSPLFQLSGYYKTSTLFGTLELSGRSTIERSHHMKDAMLEMKALISKGASKFYATVSSIPLEHARKLVVGVKHPLGDHGHIVIQGSVSKDLVQGHGHIQATSCKAGIGFSFDF